MRAYACTLLLAASSAGSPAAAAAAAPSGATAAWTSGATAAWKQDAFWISFWVGPQVALGELDSRFAELAEGNFTGYLGYNGGGAFAPNPVRVALEISLCEKHELRCVPSLCNDDCCGPLKHGGCLDLGRAPADKHFWGFQTLDEKFGAFCFPSFLFSLQNCGKMQGRQREVPRRIPF